VINKSVYERILIKDQRITLCGSTKFPEAFAFWNAHLTLAGNIVYSVAIMAHAQSPHERPNSAEKDTLDRVHLRKILNSDAIFVLDVQGYIGESTTREIAFAEKNGKQVYLLSRLFPEWANLDQAAA
jgi:hypothetical protein